MMQVETLHIMVLNKQFVRYQQQHLGLHIQNHLKVYHLLNYLFLLKDLICMNLENPNQHLKYLQLNYIHQLSYFQILINHKIYIRCTTIYIDTIIFNISCINKIMIKSLDTHPKSIFWHLLS